jgi:hypothetical protein
MSTNRKITAAVFSYNSSITDLVISDLNETELIDKIIVVSHSEIEDGTVSKIRTDYPFSSKVIIEVIERTSAPYLLIINGSRLIHLTRHTVEILISAADKKDAGWVYSDYYKQKDNNRVLHPLIDYQTGSVRDDFDFGYCSLIRTNKAKKYLANLFAAQSGSHYSGLYDLRLTISRYADIIRIREPLYSIKIAGDISTLDKMFEYLDPENREIQIEMEKVLTHHLKETGAFISSENKKSANFDHTFKYEASVIIPVKNRASTIADAIKSALRQKTKYRFNVIVVDNHSTDDTTKKINSISALDNRVIHIIPEKKDLGIGGCWNEAIFHADCGRFAVQLDSDDLYSDENTLQKIIDKFYEEKCAMVTGSYKLTDFNLNEIPPGVIDHREWTDENGHNNALRVNGFGAPRAFYTPVIREIKFPDVSYGEDYAVGLAVSRQYKVGRIFEPIYLCRRWEGNTDASISTEKQNANNFYKDSIRTQEILLRQQINRSAQK